MIFDSKPPKPKTGIAKYIPLPLLFMIIAVIGIVLYFTFRNYPEQRVVEHFLSTLEQGNYKEAYDIWQPSSNYSYQDFLRDWGPQGDYGKIRQFEVISTSSKGVVGADTTARSLKDTVLVTVRINGEDPPLTLAVDRRSKGISYSPF